LARYHALLGDEVFFNTGTDEHGLKIFQKAKEEGKDTQAYVDEYAAKFRSLKETLGLSENLHFIRTTDTHHKVAAQAIWKRCLAKGDIEKRKYKGLYCVGDEAFLKESELVDGKCPNHPTMDPVEIEEENYFFTLSKYEKPLLEYLNREGVIVPEWRRQEAINFVKNGLEDFSVSRVKEKMPWGVPVPGDDSQVMYVWFDALTNYISTLGWPEDAEGNFEKFWEKGETMQIAGKDQVRFQSIMWQAMLMSAGLSTTDKVVYHGFITSGGQKMSKSIGNVIDPLSIVREYGTDALRYFLARHVHPFEDSDVTMEKFKEAYNADLANGIGNLASRILKMVDSYKNNSFLDKLWWSISHMKSGKNTKIMKQILLKSYPEYVRAMNEYRFNDALNSIWILIQQIDKQVQETQPFRIAKTDRGTAYRYASVLSGAVESPFNNTWGRQVFGDAALDTNVEISINLFTVAVLLEPFMPVTARKIQRSVRARKSVAALFPRKE